MKPSIDAVVMRALSGQVSTRYQRAEDFLQDLLAANAQYRLLRSTGGTYQTFVARLDSIWRERGK